MPLSNSVLRRYTPPTCTLEIAAKSSPLSRLVGQSVIKDLRFELRFDDPRKPEDERVTIRGDRTELEVLYEAVSSYVQEFLDQSPTRLPLVLQTSHTTTNLRPNEERNHDSEPNPKRLVNDSAPKVAQAFERQPNQSSDSLPVSHLESDPKQHAFKFPTYSTGIYLQPRNLVAHNLFLGHLATEESGPIVNLSVLQLFDLATALDEYAAEIVALPKLNSPRSLKKTSPPMAWKIAPPPWTRTAAVVLLIVGVSAAAVKFYKPSTQQQATAPKLKASPQLSPTVASPLAGVPSPLAMPSPSSLPTPVELPSLAASSKLPPPSPVLMPPLPLSSPSTLSLPPGSQRPTISITPNLFSSPKTTTLSKRSNSAIVPDGIALLPTPTSTNRSSLTSRSSLRSSRSSTERDKTPAAQQKIASVMPTPLPLPQLPTLKPISPLTPEVSPKASPSPSIDSGTPRGNGTPSSELNRSPELNRPPSTQTAANTDNNTLFDNIPQIAEARNFLQKRWKPPTGLSQTLEYSLQLNTDGTIQRIIPRNNAAVEYLDRSSIPMPGDPFVSPVPGEGNPMLRVVLGQDGKVQTFLEK